MRTKSENIVDIIDCEDSTDLTIKAKYLALQDNLKTMSAPDILQQVFELTFPDLNYQPMSKEFVNNKEIYQNGIMQFTNNLSMMELLYNFDNTWYNYHFEFILTFNSKSVLLDDLADFLQVHCPADIPLHVTKIDNKTLEVSYLSKHDADAEVGVGVEAEADAD